MTNRFDVVAPDRQIVELEHLLRGVVHELQASLRIDDDDALDHAGENRLHPSAVARELAKPAAELLHGFVERPRHGPQFIVAVVEARGT